MRAAARWGTGGNWAAAPGQLYKPDVWWVPGDRTLDDLAPRHDVPPALVVEVLFSPGTWRFDVGRKKQVYEAAGVRELWLVAHSGVDGAGLPPQFTRERGASTKTPRSGPATPGRRRSCPGSGSESTTCSPDTDRTGDT